MKRGKMLDAEDLRNLSGTLIDVADKFRDLSAPIDCRNTQPGVPGSPRSIELSGLNATRQAGMNENVPATHGRTVGCAN